MSVGVVPGPKFVARQPVTLLEGRYFFSGPYRTYDVSSDGKRFLMIKDESQGRATASIVIVQNWHDELRRLVPTQ